MCPVIYSIDFLYFIFPILHKCKRYDHAGGQPFYEQAYTKLVGRWVAPAKNVIAGKILQILLAAFVFGIEHKAKNT